MERLTMKNSNFLGRFFKAVSDVVNGAEKSLLDLLGALIPYFVPVIPAYLTYYHTRDQMDFPVQVAWTAAFVVEVLGMTSISTAIRFYRHNQRYAKSLIQNKAPFGLAIFTYAFYLAVVLSVNVLLEVEAAKREPVIILAIALFSLLSVPSGVLISIRSQYSEMLEDREARRNPQNLAPVFATETKAVKERHASDFKDKILEMLNAEHSKSGKVLDLTDITARLKLDHAKNKGFVSSLRSEWKRSKGIE